MPYIVIKAYPKDEKTKQEVAEEINRIFLEKWGCGQSAISVRFEEFAPDDWDREVYRKEIVPNAGELIICSGEKNYPAE
ncbi:MAG: tautomerase family protein [Oscillospiraceae bacterium]|jgi:phenylpyruvate tautomerase PptA (4-oxalocrotonate tautomerase family)|nr:tautomerase family protein [Oscillospiraceae bacterium]MCR5305238.1 tautomerase family protein [Oscillospiraceae bacterium]